MTRSAASTSQSMPRRHTTCTPSPPDAPSATAPCARSLTKGRTDSPELLAACDHHVSVGIGVEGGGLDLEPNALQLRHEFLVPEWPDGQPLRAGTDRPIRLDHCDGNLQGVLLLPALLDLPVVGDDRIAAVAADESISGVQPRAAGAHSLP